jgi:hypothetical protein
MSRIRRPNPLRWLWYAFGGRLPPENREWVLHDVTTRTWWLRHLLRAMVQLAVPIVLILVFLPGPFYIRGLGALSGVFLGLIFAGAYMTETCENRVMRAGYPVGTAEATRQRLNTERERAHSERVRRRYGR